MVLFREVLHGPSSLWWGAILEGLNFILMGAHGYYTWNVKYLKHMLAAAAAIGVIEGHSTGSEEMHMAQWEIYDKVHLAAESLHADTITSILYSPFSFLYLQECGLGLWYNPSTKEWQDKAISWLDP